MTPEEARSIIDKGEGQQCEFKESFSSHKEAIESLVAFSNADGGTVFFGVKDDGTETGVTIGQKTLEDFANRLKASTDPALTPPIEQMVIKRKEVISVTVPRRGQGELYLAFGRPQIRVGRTNQVMSVAQMRQSLLDGNVSGVTVSQMVDYVQTEIERSLQGGSESSFFPVHFRLGNYAEVSVNVHGYRGGYTLSGLIAEVNNFEPSWSEATIVLIIDGQRTSNLALSLIGTGIFTDTTGVDTLVSGDLTSLDCELVANGSVIAQDRRILNVEL